MKPPKSVSFSFLGISKKVEQYDLSLVYISGILFFDLFGDAYSYSSHPFFGVQLELIPADDGGFKNDKVSDKFGYVPVWVCLKIGYIPNEIAI